MLNALAVSQVVLWIVVVVLAATVLALARQIGVLHERIAPMGALTIDKGPKVGEVAPVFALNDLNSRMLNLGAPDSDGVSTMLMFVSPSCPVCKKLLPIVKSIAEAEARWLRLVFTSDGDEPAQRDFIRLHRIEAYPMLLSSELGMTYRVSKLPYAVLIDEAGRVRAKGLVNTREHLESIIAAKQMGVASIQDYLRERNGGITTGTAARATGSSHSERHDG